MWDLVAQLSPEMVGLAVTPAAVIACLMLLGSSHPFRNVACLAGAFLAVYGVISVVAVVLGRAADPSSDDSSTAHGWVSLVAGVLFLTGAVVSWLHPPRTVEVGKAVPLPGWAARLEDPSPTLVVGVGLVLAVLNPNVAILASGLTLVVGGAGGDAEEVVGIILLLSASMLDFVLPTLAFAVSGAAGRDRLRRTTRWLIVHNHVIGVVVLTAFGLLFAGRGVVQLLG